MKGLGASAAGALALGSNRGLSATASANGTLEIGLVSTVVGGPAMAVGWALREYEVIGSDPPAEGLTPSALRQQVYQTALTRESTNASTILDNQTILDGIQHTAYIEAKRNAIEQLNAGATESEVLTAANEAANAYFTTVEKNMLKSWNESVQEFYLSRSALESHADTNVTNTLSSDADGSAGVDSMVFGNWLDQSTTDVSLIDGSTFTVQSLGIQLVFGGSESYTGDDANTINADPTGMTFSDPSRTYNESNVNVIASNGSGDSVTYLFPTDWMALYSDIQTTQSNVSDGLSTWVTSVYGQVQSGEIEISDLLTPRERAAMMADGEGTSQALADLIALNVPVDLEREATITIEDTSATLSGTFALTDSSDGPIESGTTYNPSNLSGDVYFTADMSLVEGDWTAFETSVDGGNITVTSEPYEGTTIEVTTTAGETVSAPAGDWTDNGDGTWTYDASDDLETAITEVDSARYVATSTETQYETIQLQTSFTVDKLINTESGEEVSTTNFSNSEPQNDSNYITQEEWDQLQQQNQELIEKYENSQGGGSFSLDGLDLFGLPGEVVALGAAALVAIGILGN